MSDGRRVHLSQNGVARPLDRRPDRDRWIRTDRSAERRAERPVRDRDRDARPGRYARLMQVDIRHGYYAGSGTGDECPDFAARPTPPTSGLMRALGLLFRPEPAGFSVLYDVARADGLFWYLRQHGTPPDGVGERQHWTRLSFVLSLTNLRFVNFTNIPVQTNPNSRNFYFTNQDAHHADGGRIVLTHSDHVDGRTLPVVGPQVRVETPEGVFEVLARDIAGETVITVPRCVSQPSSPPSPPVCRNFVFLDFSTLPEDKYTIETIGSASLPREILYTVAAPVPLCFIDLLLTRPTATATGIYPVRDLYPETATTIKPLRYELRFEARATYWRYYIQPPPHQQLEDLAIETMGPNPPVAFAGPVPVRLVNGGLAYRFVSEEALVLQRRSPYRFRLKGRRAMRTVSGDDVLAQRLAVASTEQVVPQREADASFKSYSDIYVSV